MSTWNEHLFLAAARGARQVVVNAPPLAPPGVENSEAELFGAWSPPWDYSPAAPRAHLLVGLPALPTPTHFPGVPFVFCGTTPHLSYLCWNLRACFRGSPGEDSDSPCQGTEGQVGGGALSGQSGKPLPRTLQRHQVCPDFSHRGTSQLSCKGSEPGGPRMGLHPFSEVGAVAGSVRSSTFLVGVEIGPAALESVVSTKANHLPHPATLPIHSQVCAQEN